MQLPSRTGDRLRRGCVLVALACLAAVFDADTARSLAVELELVTFATRPLYLTHAGDQRLFIVQRDGVIHIRDPERGLLAQPFLDLSDVVDDSLDGGLYALAFHPNYPTPGHLFVSYTEAGDGADVPLRGAVARYTVSQDDPNRADPASRALLLRLDQPGGSHNTADLGFGPDDGYLYVAIGDGGLSEAPDCRAQWDDAFFGKLLRLDVDGEPDVAPYYTIPPDNPFADPKDGVLDEIFAKGFRHPWRFAFDRDTGDLYIGDVGRGAREEIDVLPADSGGGQNYGWKAMEGTTCFDADRSGCPVDTPACSSSAYTPPIYEYETTRADCAVVGGAVYRGRAIPALRGSYVFGDVCSQRIWSLVETEPGVWTRSEIHPGGSVPGRFAMTSFGSDVDRELYAMIAGRVYRLPEPSAVRLSCVALTTLGLLRRRNRLGFPLRIDARRAQNGDPE